MKTEAKREILPSQQRNNSTPFDSMGLKAIFIIYLCIKEASWLYAELFVKYVNDETLKNGNDKE